MYIVPPGPLQGVSVYGSLCTGTCSQGLDNFYYCEVPPQVLILMIKTVSGMIKQAKIPNKSELLNHFKHIVFMMIYRIVPYWGTFSVTLLFIKGKAFQFGYSLGA